MIKIELVDQQGEVINLNYVASDADLPVTLIGLRKGWKTGDVDFTLILRYNHGHGESQ